MKRQVFPSFHRPLYGGEIHHQSKSKTKLILTLMILRDMNKIYSTNERFLKIGSVFHNISFLISLPL